LDKANWGTMRWGRFRWGTYNNAWNDLMQRLEAVGVGSQDVTRRRLKLGAQDSVTGWYKPSYSTSTVEMVIIPRASTQTATAAGTYVRTDCLGLSAAGLEEGDELLTGHGVYYEVKATRDVYIGDSFHHRESDLTILPMWA